MSNPPVTYQVTRDDVALLAAATRDLDYLNCYIKGYLSAFNIIQQDTEVNQPIAAIVARLHAAIVRIAGPDAGEIYATDDGSTADSKGKG